MEDVFSLGKGFEYNVQTLKWYMLHYDTDKPWAYWPGYKSKRYQQRIARWMRNLGAPKGHY